MNHYIAACHSQEGISRVGHFVIQYWRMYSDGGGPPRKCIRLHKMFQILRLSPVPDVV